MAARVEQLATAREELEADSEVVVSVAKAAGSAGEEAVARAAVVAAAAEGAATAAAEAVAGPHRDK